MFKNRRTRTQYASTKMKDAFEKDVFTKIEVGTYLFKKMKRRIWKERKKKNSNFTKLEKTI